MSKGPIGEDAKSKGPIRHDKTQRRLAYGWGRQAERLAAWYLRLQGYVVLAERVRTPVGEVDLIVRRGNSLVFVEVKARRAVSAGLEALTPHALSRVRRAAHWWLAGKPALSQLEMRLDALIVRPWRVPVHLKAIG
jgi:putative endonuclease